MVAQLVWETRTAEQVQACLEARGWLAELSPGGEAIYHLWAAKGRRVWLLHVRPLESYPSTAIIEEGQRLDLEARQLRATAVVAGVRAGACWFVSLRTGRLLAP